MHNQRIYPQYDAPQIPVRHMSWFVQMLMVLAVVIVAGLVYGFWQTAAIPLPAQGSDNPPLPPTNEESQTGSRAR
jgi:hypothetical protein